MKLFVKQIGSSINQLDQDILFRTAPGLGNRDRSARTGQFGWDSQDMIVKTVQLGQDSRNRKKSAGRG
jgi:hypothetical protein